MKRVLKRLDQILRKQALSNWNTFLAILRHTNINGQYLRGFSIVSAFICCAKHLINSTLMADPGKLFQDANFVMKFISEDSLFEGHIRDDVKLKS